MATISEIYNWFMTGKKPTQAQFWASWGSFWNKSEPIPQSAVSNLTTVLNAKSEKTQFDAHKIDPNAHAESIGMKTDKGDYEGTSGDLDSRIAAIENPDRVLKFGTITVTGLNVDIASNAFSWVLNKQEFLTPAVFNDTLDAATTGMYRSDVVVGTQTGGYDIITGDEAATGAGATEKAPPAGTIRLGYIFLQGNTVLGSGSAPAEEKSTIIDTDRIVFDNSQNSYAKASIKLSNFKTVLKVWLDSFFKDRYVTIVDNVTTAYTLQLSDGTKNTLIRHNNASAITETIPANATVALPIGTEIKSISIGVGLRTVTPAAGVTILNHVSLTSAQNQMMRFIKTATNTWVVTGDVGFEKDIKLTNYPSTRNDGTLPTNKTFSVDSTGNLKLYSMAILPAPYIAELIPDSYLPSTTGNIQLLGEFFIPAMCLSVNLNNGNGIQITGQTINYATFVNSQKILLNVTTGSAEGSFSVTCNNGLSITKANALLIVLGTVFTPKFSDWTSQINIDVSDTGVAKIATYNSLGTAKATNITINHLKNWEVRFSFQRSPLGDVQTAYGIYEFTFNLQNSVGNNIIRHTFYVNHVAGNIYVTGATATESNSIIKQFAVPGADIDRLIAFEAKTIQIRFISGILYTYIDNTLVKTWTQTVIDDLFITVSLKQFDIKGIKYIELAT
ncbi:hypothetical protein [Flavobacterium aquicola]|uniref:Uncharacterized protein n=1 Tax=Flavobacterium aquicola TaxID=1682742 RepID=A0A3E0EQ37_9FLAO|nr:hypothetical protein [Flavobacterium aquicola]REH00259.1 hypothetical protein C8P67_103235 [Flavobacterium aquicola]